MNKNAKLPHKSKVIVSAAITGSIHTPTMSEWLPYRPQDIAAHAIGAAEAGAAILHLHARDPNTGQPTPATNAYMNFLPAIKEGCDAVMNITTGGGLTMSIEERLAAPLHVKPEMCSLNMGSMNFALHPLADRFDKWNFDWEEPYLRGTEAGIFRNTFADIAEIMQRLGEHGTKFEHECYDVGHLYNLAHFVDRGLVKPPFFVQMVFGVLGGIGADQRNLHLMHETAERLFGTDYLWSVLAAGRQQIPFGTEAAMLGGNLRVGLEDNLFMAPGQLAKNSAEQVIHVSKIVTELGYEIATPTQARTLLGLKGADLVDV